MLNEYMRNNRVEKHKWLVKQIECNDGFTMSVQGSEYNYCSPRVNDAEYTQVEVGFPSAKPLFFAEYAEGSGYNDEETGSVEFFDYTQTVYGYVPIELVEQEIIAHGGIKNNVLLIAD